MAGRSARLMQFRACESPVATGGRHCKWLPRLSAATGFCASVTPRPESSRSALTRTNEKTPGANPMEERPTRDGSPIERFTRLRRFTSFGSHNTKERAE